MSTVYERIKEIRTRLGISQVEFSERIFIGKSFYGDIEIGKKKVNKRIIFIISKQFNVNEEWISTGEGEMFTDNPPDIRKEKLLNIYNQLEGSLRECLVEQSGVLLKFQKENNNKKG
ncbi:helix-turn-helix domain protein [Treponema primitia ZAS-2]|uniref:Helix-turn-helix domain protein n=1 Tax=Treponema primitia (strain ATCC BAA-887 / DSM 12427 / ZAS-2) TaxID=545694 RepID=F5YQ66_TREPZ|nr:helix-turn-helix transcriptional regulator [Treponema primitia]AEF86781.1 helix-turn-helix domain protein [Treponema primitia ZAS-2]